MKFETTEKSNEMQVFSWNYCESHRFKNEFHSTKGKKLALSSLYRAMCLMKKCSVRGSVWQVMKYTGKWCWENICSRLIHNVFHLTLVNRDTHNADPKLSYVILSLSFQVFLCCLCSNQWTERSCIQERREYNLCKFVRGLVLWLNRSFQTVWERRCVSLPIWWRQPRVLPSKVFG